MKKGILISILIICFIIGGFFLTRAMNQADDIALSDNFTSGFIDENIETDEGFHYFESGNGKFSMWFPGGYYLSADPAQFESKETYEMLNLYQEATGDSTLDRHIQIEYFGEMDQEKADLTLSRILENFSYKNSYEVKDSNDLTISYGEVHVELNGKDTVLKEPKTNPANRYFALIETKNSKHVVAVTYMLFCKESSSCEINSKEEQNFFRQLSESIEYK
ncbi:hypothetical protein JOC54_000234 [Alkalihalobacillus xiaoxiensis]|uniref:PsbP C-terminal domain-containing protein n=1 Tax=Shouchella xiaoxiensis TaxID=766895 RepID=A0ABS2SNA2_9BACI|nr:hypothetical protein [Shouchella xiaoxiensis]MBM7837003.1 hypothetical protein [Shouchella xiaoxiensis]